MTLRARRIVYSLFIAAFIVTAPLVIIYTQGYRYNLKHQRLEPTGTLVLSTIPKGATISLNGQVIKFLTPKTLQAVLPGTYTIRLSKDSYKTWEKRLKVKAGEAIFVSNVRLWRETMPKRLSQAIYQIFSPNPDTTAILLTTWSANKEQLLLFDKLSGKPPTVIAERPMRNPSDQIIWSAQATRALVAGPDETAIVELNQNPSWQSLSSFVPKTISDFRWDPEYDDLLYGSDGASVYRLDLSSKKITPLVPLTNVKQSKQTLTGYWIENNTLYELIQRDDDHSILRSTPLLTTNSGREMILPTNYPYKLLDQKDDLIALIDSAKTMSLWRLAGESLLPVFSAPNVKQAIFLKTTGDLLYSSPFELWTYNPKTGAQTLLTRIAAEVDQAAWFPDGSHVIFASNHAVFFLERDERDIRNQWMMMPFQDLVGYAVSQDGKEMYFAGTIGSDSGLWRLDL
ncbi:hypothetical protein A3E96_01405 [Candidatus Uhrbacteria bacterium RIFCSPHIGHO2_12_FULL_46_13]|nr:MAG: hypothetical protein A3E96_01405 [Candidatus Uhrbacteria bacterium RIFCSPHIGHO2_12_FULL_46_13]